MDALDDLVDEELRLELLLVEALHHEAEQLAGGPRLGDRRDLSSRPRRPGAR
ncbi:hypothetical protein [Streptosporangium carneum]|uniref:hypothetical protein n=1 Tax=Streptosporangium carneum TaxID=47481 RepID=UPI0022F32822|nr:hypothetical protein [Streptosporangium carneum]